MVDGNGLVCILLRKIEGKPVCALVPRQSTGLSDLKFESVFRTNQKKKDIQMDVFLLWWTVTDSNR